MFLQQTEKHKNAIFRERKTTKHCYKNRKSVLGRIHSSPAAWKSFIDIYCWDLRTQPREAGMAPKARKKKQETQAWPRSQNTSSVQLPHATGCTGRSKIARKLREKNRVRPRRYSQLPPLALPVHILFYFICTQRKYADLNHDLDNLPWFR